MSFAAAVPLEEGRAAIGGDAAGPLDRWTAGRHHSAIIAQTPISYHSPQLFAGITTDSVIGIN